MPPAAPTERRVTRTVHFHLPDPMRGDAAAGRVNVINRILAELPGWNAHFHDDSPAERVLSLARDGRSIWHMQTPPDDRGLCLRRAYWYPFWTLDRTNDRWNTETARAAYDPATVDETAARPFFRRLRRRIVGDVAAGREGFVLMPLQGRLTRHRGFQAMSPVEMVEATLAADRRPVVATLHPHPKEPYADGDRAAIEALARRNPRLTLREGGSDALLPQCELVVTQNSSTVLTGFLLRKPAVLFAGTDFHHIAGSVPRDGLDAAFARARAPLSDPALYLYWFLCMHAINAGSDGAGPRIRETLAGQGWPV
jgi:hypothetical protein